MYTCTFNAKIYHSSDRMRSYELFLYYDPETVLKFWFQIKAYMLDPLELKPMIVFITIFKLNQDGTSIRKNAIMW